MELRTQIGKMNKYCIFLLMEFILYTHKHTNFSGCIYNIEHFTEKNK